MIILDSPGIWPMPRVAAASLPHGETASQHRAQVMCDLNQRIIK